MKKRSVFKKTATLLLNVAMLSSMLFIPVLAEETESTAYINSVGYDTLGEAFEAANTGDEVLIKKAGTYELSTSGKDITITGAVDGVIFDDIGAKNMGGANVTFNNVTFDYYPNTNYTGLQHAGNLTYNNVTFNGQVFLYGASETFNNCTFNQNDSESYNVWTYGANSVKFSGTTFNSAGKSVLVYNEGGNATELNVENTKFNASSAVEGKAAIEIDTSLMPAGTTIKVDDKTTTTGFGTGSVSGNSLWNDKKNQENLDVSVGESKVWPIAEPVASIGSNEYPSLDEAFAAAVAGDEVKILKAGTYALNTSGKDITITGVVDGVVFDNIGGKNMGGANVTFNNVTFDYYPNGHYTGLQHSGNMVYNNVTFNGQVFLYGESETFNSCTFNQNDSENYNVWTYGARSVKFNNSTFNSAGKSVLVYNEGGNTTALEVANTKFNASSAVEGKAAIEIDTSLMPEGTTIKVDDKTTATGFGTGSVSGNSLWNDKKNQENLDVTVNNSQVWPKVDESTPTPAPTPTPNPQKPTSTPTPDNTTVSKPTSKPASTTKPTATTKPTTTPTPESTSTPGPEQTETTPSPTPTSTPESTSKPVEEPIVVETPDTNTQSGSLVLPLVGGTCVIAGVALFVYLRKRAKK